MPLLNLFNKKRWLDLEDAWTEYMLEDGHDIEPVLALLQAARERKETARLMTLIREHYEALKSASRFEDAATIIGKALLGGGSPGELGDFLFEATEMAWSDEAWWPLYVETTGFAPGCSDVRKAWESFANLKAFAPGAVIFHPSGWGLGQVQSVDLEAREIHIKFANGRPDHFPFTTAVDIFEVLEEGDLRALVLLDPERLKDLIKKDPLEVVRAILARNHGRITVPLLRNAMAQLGVAGPGFTAWWRKARKEAEKSEWFEVIGTAQKAQIRLLSKAADPAESLRRQLERSPSLGDALSRVRDLLSGKNVEEELANVGVEVLGVLAEAENEPLPHRLASWMLIREQTGGQTPEQLKRLAEDSLNDPDVNAIPALWDLFGMFTAMRDQERCLSLLKEIMGEDHWLDDGAKNLKHAPTGMARPLVDALLADGRLDVLTEHYRGLLARPMRNPQAFVALAELAENGKIEHAGSSSAQRLHAMLQLAVYLKNEAGASSPLARAHKRLVTLLTSGEPALVDSLCRDCDLEALRTAHLIVENGADVTLDRAFTHVIAAIAPEIFKAGERPFWESETLWTTRSGLARRQAELRELLDVKIPDNAEAIGRAASYGDLSENSEWDAALEEQRNLTTRASEIEAEVSKAGLIENAIIPEGVVAPGTVVRFVEAESGDERTMRILGPWDTTEEGVISYRSPLAMGMLGKRKGQTANLKLPSGELEVDILEVDALELPV
mgnify:CR=1 FL=1